MYVGGGSQCVFRAFRFPPEVVGVSSGVGGMAGIVHSSRSVLGVRGGVGGAAGAAHMSLSLFELLGGGDIAVVVVVEVLFRLSSVLLKTARAASSHVGSRLLAICLISLRAIKYSSRYFLFFNQYLN